MPAMIDIHNHMLPGLDDGPDGWEETLLMASMAVSDGIEGVVCTPHWAPGLMENTHLRVSEAVETLRGRLHEEGIALDVYPGAELRLDVGLIGAVRSGRLLSINDTGKYALVELPFVALPQGLEHFIAEFPEHGITPVIAHPERNMHLCRQPERLYEMVRMGALAQLTSDSLLGRYGEEIRDFSIMLLKHDLAHVLATDAHGAQWRSPGLSEARGAVEAIAGKEAADRMVRDVPLAIVQGRSISVPDPIPVEAAGAGKGKWRFPSWRGLFCGWK